MCGARPLCDGRVVGGDPEGVEAAEGGQGGEGPREQGDLHSQTVSGRGSEWRWGRFRVQGDLSGRGHEF